MPITFDFILFSRDFVWKFPIEKNGHKWIYFGDSEQEMEDAIFQYGSKEEIDAYYAEKDKKYYKDLFELLEEQK